MLGKLRVKVVRKIVLPQRYAFSHKEQKDKFFKVKDGLPQDKSPVIYPDQYPKYSLNDNALIISRDRPIRYLTPKNQIPKDLLMEGDDFAREVLHKGNWKSPQNSYTLNIGLIGPVNAGKSQLFGALAHRISAVSPKAATTTEILNGYKSFERESQQGIKNVQLKYFDTPGLMYKKQGFISKGWKVLSEIDFSLMVVDSAKRFDDMIKESIKRLQKHRDYPNFMKALVLNKIDLVDNRRKFDSLIREIEKYGKFDKIFYISAKTGYGIQELQEYLIRMAKKNQWESPPESMTKMTNIEIFEQMLKEGLFLRVYEEVPHDLDIECTSYSPMSDGKDKLIFTVYVGSENQQRLTIGKKGKNIEEAISRFKVLYAQLYQKQAQILVSVRIRNKFKQKFRGREQIDLDDTEQQNQQVSKALNQSLNFKRNKGQLNKIIQKQKQQQELRTTLQAEDLPQDIIDDGNINEFLKFK